MAGRAGVSESIFRDVFSTVEECYQAAFDEGLKRLSSMVTDAASPEVAWLERVRSGLVAMLGFFDDEPGWARLLVLDTPLNAAVTVECRQRLHNLLAALLERVGEVSEGCGNGRAAGSPMLLATLGGELIVGGVFSVIRTSMIEGGDGKLVELAPSLMAFIVAPYLGQAAAQAELEGRPLAARAELESRPAVAGDALVDEPSAAGGLVAGESGLARERAISRASELPIRVTHRTTLVLRVVAQAPYSNNREIAQAAGLTDEGQTSKLLARLERKGVIENVGVGAARGEPNAWLLTASGRRTVQLLAASPAAEQPKRRAGTRGAA